MQSEIDVADVEPSVPRPESFQLRESLELVTLYSPSPRLVRDSREGVRHGVDVGTDIQPMKPAVVGDVYNGREGRYLAQASKQLRRSRAARDYHDTLPTCCQRLLSPEEVQLALPKHALYTRFAPSVFHTPNDCHWNESALPHHELSSGRGLIDDGWPCHP